MNQGYVMAFDAGTTGVRTIIFNDSAQMVSEASREYRQIFPQTGWIEQDPVEIFQTQLDTMKEALHRARLSIQEIGSIGITNQRQTTVVWDRFTGRPVYHAVVWGSRQSVDYVEKWASAGLNSIIREKTGLVNDAFFSASKIAWILDHAPGARIRAEKGELLFGTIDTWLIWNLTKGKTHATDYSNASGTMLYNIHTLEWDEDLCREFDVPLSLLPEVRDSNGDYGETSDAVVGARIPIRGNAGDQQASLFGQGCFTPGMAKNTFGTAGVFVMNTGSRPVYLDGLSTTIAWGLDKKVTYALEGVIFTSGATIQWLRDGARMIPGSSDSEWFASQTPDTEGVYFVPAFTGLCAPFWDMYARGLIIGLTRGTTHQHIIRAGLEAMAYQTKDIIDCVLSNGDIEIPELRVDGGAVKNNLLCQFQADILGLPVIRPTVTEMTALGAAYLAGLGVGLWESMEEISSHWQVEKRFEPQMSAQQQRKLYFGWRAAVELTRDWSKKLEQLA